MFTMTLFLKRAVRTPRCLGLSHCVLALVLGILCRTGTANELDLGTLIDRIQTSYERTPALTAQFVQVAALTSIHRQQTSAGQLSIAKPHHMRWEYTQPDAQTILYDGNLLRIYTPKRRQVLQSVVDETSRSNVALLFLAGIGKLREAFEITPLSHTDTKTRRLRLLPRSPLASFAELHIVVNLGNYLVEQFTIHDTVGNITEIRLNQLTISQELPPQTLELVLPPGTEVLTPTDLSGQR